MEYNTNGPRPDDATKDYLPEAMPVFERPYTDEELYKMAVKRVQARKALITHICVYLAVNLLLMFIAFSNGEAWNFYVLGGWGIGVVCHIASYFMSATPEAIHKEYLRQRNRYYK